MSFSRIVLVGSGHANIQVIKAWSMRSYAERSQLVLVADQFFAPYSGMLPGWLAGYYSESETYFDLWKICQRAGAVFYEDRCEMVDAPNQRVKLAGRGWLSYDKAAINVGIRPHFKFQVDTASLANVLPLKPIGALFGQWNELVQEIQRTRSKLKVAVIGGGASGCETAVAAVLRAQLLERDLEVHLFHSSATLLSEHNPSAGLRMRRALSQLQVQVHAGTNVERIEGSSIFAGSKTFGPFAKIIVATQASAPAWFVQSGLPLNESHFLSVDASLKVKGAKNLFGAGDCIDFNGESLPKSGVYAVRQGPILIHNLLEARDESEYKTFHPQARTLALMTSGPRQAIATYGRWSSEGSWAWLWKDAIDRKFMHRFGFSDVMPMMKDVPTKMPSTEVVNTCGGCGSKAPWDLVQKILKEMGVSGPVEDCTPVPKHQGELYSSCDAFRSFIPDLYLFTKIACYHALNDLLVSRIKPLQLSVAVTLQSKPISVQENDLRMIFSALAEVVEEFSLHWGKSHTAEGSESALSVHLIGEGRSGGLSKRGAVVGDKLILTRPLGSGVLLQSLMKGALAGSVVHSLLRQLSQSPRIGSEMLADPAVHAATDVTGFGLIGHLTEMCGGDQSAQILAESVPVYESFRQELEKGHRPALLDGNARTFAKDVEVSGALEKFPQFYDPQTHGGWLLAVDKEQVGRLLAQLREVGLSHSVVMGEFMPRSHRDKKISIV